SCLLVVCCPLRADGDPVITEAHTRHSKGGRRLAVNEPVGMSHHHSRLESGFLALVKPRILLAKSSTLNRRVGVRVMDRLRIRTLRYGQEAIRHKRASSHAMRGPLPFIPFAS